VKRFAAPLALTGLLAGATLLAAPAAPDRFVDVLDLPARPSALAPRRLLQATAFAGSRLVAAGARGHVVVSDDGGATWQQADVPVSADLTALHFVDANLGWAVGHDGVVLHTRDGGRHWERQLDGRDANALALAHARRLAAAEPETHAELLAEAERADAEGPSRPFLDVWFADAREGFAVGAYDLVFHTGDGGTTWEPWGERTDNPGFHHLYGIRGSGDDVYAVGELGLLLRLDREAGRFEALPSPYAGSWFGVLAKPGLVLAFGLRGNAWRSRDGGRTWDAADTGITASITAGQVLADGRLLLASQAGDLLVSDDDGARFRRVDLPQPTATAGVAVAGDTVLLSGPRGVRVERARL
jgi:photosystem II stability/assembly factor-like uncharacterized protein